MPLYKRPLFIALIDAAILNVVIVATFSVRFSGYVPELNFSVYKSAAPFITLIYIVMLYLQGLYEFDEEDDAVAVFFKVLSSIAAGTVGVAALVFAIHFLPFPRTVMAISAPLMLLSLGMWRVALQQMILRASPPLNAVIIGAGRLADMLSGMMAHDKLPRFRILKVAGTDTLDEVRAMVARGEAEGVIVTDEVYCGASLGFELMREYPQVHVYLIPGVQEIVMGVFHHRLLGDIPLVSLSHKPIAGRMLLLKRLIDFGVSLGILLMFSPLLLFVAALIKLTSKGPVFYTQDRAGMDGRQFNIYKFRTMVSGAEEYTGPTLSTQDDPRVTPVGRLLRRFKIDEIPQIINVFKGEMSMVGPRPERPVFVERFESEIPGFALRKKVLPGLTGLAQVNGTYETDPSLKLKYDMLYIYNYRPLMDLKILYQTAQHLIRVNI